MKALAIIIQNKKGENHFVIVSNNFSYELAKKHSALIYEFISLTYSNNEIFHYLHREISSS